MHSTQARFTVLPMEEDMTHHEVAPLTRALARFIDTSAAATLAVRLHADGLDREAMAVAHSLEAEEATDDLLDMTTGRILAVLGHMHDEAPGLARDLMELVERRLAEPDEWSGLMDGPEMGASR